MKSPRNHPKKSSKFKRGSAEAAGGNYWSRPCIRLMPVTICSSETGRGCCPHPRVTAAAEKDRNCRAACPLPGQRLSIFSILAPERAKKLSIGVHGVAENRENQQPLDRERDLGRKRERIRKGREVNERQL